MMQALKKRKWRETVLDILICVIGSVLFAISTYYFTAPHQIAPGGVSGIATITYYLFGFPIGLTTFVLNIPLLILGILYLGKPFILKSGLCVVVYTLMVDLVFPLISMPVFESENTLLAALFGGVLVGAGLGLIFTRDASTGGSDILARLLQKKLPYIPLGRLLSAIDMTIVLVSVFAFNSIESGLFALICIFVCGKVIDVFLYGQDTGKQVMIITAKWQECTDVLLKELDRGITMLDGKGGYTGEKKEVLVCVVRRNEFQRVKRIVKSIDPKAFLIVSEVSEVFGEGFKEERF